MTAGKIPSSFRDPSGFVFSRDGILYRQINQSYQKHYKMLMDSGLYRSLTQENLLIPHAEVPVAALEQKTAWKCIQPEKIDFPSFPYEWSFSMLKDAALLTLAIQKKALAHGMILKDASAYNVFFRGSKPVWIDTLSFEIYQPGKPWIAYKQFCEHFLAPLAIAAYRDIRFLSVLSALIEGVPLDLASRLLPFSAKWKPGLFLHLILHAASQKKFAAKHLRNSEKNRFSLIALLGLIDSLESSIRSVKLKMPKTVWRDYYEDDSYTETALREKEKFVTAALEDLKPESVWDLGANTGRFSRIAEALKIPVLSVDGDPACVELNYLESKKTGSDYLTPLVINLSNPSPAIGWQNKERPSWLQRGKAQMAMALALIHHLAISKNLPLEYCASFFSGVTTKYLLIEFVPKEDSKAQLLLSVREDIFPDYRIEIFEKVFSAFFHIEKKFPIPSSARTLYLMRKLE